MIKSRRSTFLWLRSDNRQSKIQKRPRGPKWAGIFAIGFTFAFGWVAAHAQQTAKIHRIGVLNPNTAEIHGARMNDLRQGLRDLGYIEGRNLIIEYRYAEGKVERLTGLASELVRLKVSVIIASSTPAAMAARDATKEVPIVFSSTGDPLASGLVTNLARPEGNVTGVTMGTAELAGKRLELLTEVVPKLSVAAILYNPDISTRVTLQETQTAGQGLKVRITAIEVRTVKDIDGAFESAKKSKAGGITFVENPPITTYPQQVVELAVKTRLPAIYARTDWCEIGGLVCYGRDVSDTYKRLAVYVDKILKGVKPADIPVEQSMKLHFVFNLKAAKQIGLTIPPNVLVRADRVVK
jgi:putative ABC transport system substrate-binding protein